MLARREFLQRAAIGAAILGIPVARAEQMFSQDNIPLPAPGLLSSDPERYWAELRRQWLLASDRVNLNCGSVGCTPLPILRAMIDHILFAESYREPAYPWFGYEENTRLRDLRDSLATFLHCKRDELALVRNATEANNVVCNGFDMKPGEEVLMTDQEHPGGKCCWEQKAARFGTKISCVTLPKPPATKQQIVDLFARAIKPETKMIFFSHITTVTGVILPAKEICAMARSRGVLTCLDGAHAIGQVPLDLHDIGCDFYGSSPHKWLMAPKGTGFLYLREETLDKVKLWVNIASGEWKNYDMKAYRFSNFGTSNLSVFVGLKAALDFFNQIGPEKVYARSHMLATRVRDFIAKQPQLKVVNASSDEFFGTLVSFEPAPGSGMKDLSRIAQECSARNIRIAGGGERIRIATHIFTQPNELSAFFDAVSAGLRA